MVRLFLSSSATDCRPRKCVQAVYSGPGVECVRGVPLLCACEAQKLATVSTFIYHLRLFRTVSPLVIMLHTILAGGDSHEETR